MEKAQKQENKQRKKVKFIVIREFSGDKTMQEAFEQVIERQTSLKNGWKITNPNRKRLKDCLSL